MEKVGDIFTITAEILAPHWLIFIVNKRTDTLIYDATIAESGRFDDLLL